MSEVKVNKISPRTNCGTVQLGDSGDTITIPAGATITNNGTAAGFGATGAASWDTTVKTSGFTAVSGVGYFVNTTSGAISVNLPAGVAGAVVAIKDYANTFDTNNVTLVQNGSDKIGGSTINATLSTEGLAVTLVYVDATQGWLVTDSGLQNEAPTEKYVTATGGTITCSGDYRIHTFTGPGTFCVSCAGNAGGSNAVSYMVIAGGGGGALGPGINDRGGGGGAGGFREGKASTCSYTASPLNAPAGLPVPAQAYPIVVGAGAAEKGSFGGGNDGSNSSFSTITSAGGGGGGRSSPSQVGASGGSGGGGGGGVTGGTSGAAGNTPPVSPPQGNNGGTGGGTTPNVGGGGGGGATAVGGSAGPGIGGNGGTGATTSINGTPTGRAGGGAGCKNASATCGGAGGPGANVAGTANTGGGGQGGHPCGGGNGTAGGSGIVIIRYKFQN
jgi:hypothetical protein